MSAPHVGMRRLWSESHGRRGLFRGGRVVGSRESGSSSTAQVYKTGGALATANGQAGEWAGHKRRRKAEHGGVGAPYSRGASGPVLVVSVNEVGKFFWRSWAWRLVGSVSRQLLGAVGSPGGAVEETPEPKLRVTSQRAIGSPNPASSGFV